MPGLDVHNRRQLVASRDAHKRQATTLQRARQAELKLVAHRNKQLHALEATQHPAAVAARFMLYHTGWHEDPGRPNRAAWLDKWAREIGPWMEGQPWCGLAVWKAAQAAGVTLSKETVSTVAIRRMAQSGTGGFKAWHPATATPRIGWVPVYGTAVTGPVHTGLVVAAGKIGEGNTSPGKGGSQNNGGGLYIRTLTERRGWILGYAEIDWSKAK